MEMFWNNKMCEYDNLRRDMGEKAAFERYVSQIGKLAIASANDDNSTRLFIRAVVLQSERKNGWWDTFTITNKPCKKGVYICRIDKVKKDKDGYPIFVVDPLKEIDESIINYYWSGALKVLSNSNLFIDACTLFAPLSGNTDALIDYSATLDESIKDTCCIDQICAKIVHLVIDGKITINEIDKLLSKPTKNELGVIRIKEMSSDIFLNPEKYIERYYFIIEAFGRACDKPGFSPYECIMGLYDKYDWNVNIVGSIDPVDGDIFDQVEYYLRFDNKRKKANKAAKSAAKKAKKAAKKAGN